MENNIIIIGAGGHAKVVISSLHAADIAVAAVYDDDQEKWGCEISKCKVRGPLSMIGDLGRETAVMAVGDNYLRSRLVSRFEKLNWITVIHPSAYVHPSVIIGAGTVVFAGAVIQPDTIIGKHCIINSGVTIDHDCIIGDYVHIAPGTNLAGGVKVGDGVFLGIGSAAIIGITIGKWTTIGAGGIVIHDIPPNAVAVGVPAKVIKYKENLNTY
jgi:sugar O-acyltransferase (sialic acid O-acetyltransferase NeuD family)